MGGLSSFLPPPPPSSRVLSLAELGADMPLSAWYSMYANSAGSITESLKNFQLSVRYYH